jgi:hypothetical protein
VTGREAFVDRGGSWKRNRRWIHMHQYIVRTGNCRTYGPTTIPMYSLPPKIFVLFDFNALYLTIRLIQNNCENIIYFAMTYFIIIYIQNIIVGFTFLQIFLI